MLVSEDCATTVDWDGGTSYFVDSYNFSAVPTQFDCTAVGLDPDQNGLLLDCSNGSRVILENNGDGTFVFDGIKMNKHFECAD
jgi:hypothetical protein